MDGVQYNKIYHGNCIEVLKTWPAGFIDMCITSPPYWALRDYGTAIWEGGDPDCRHLNRTLASSTSTLRSNRGRNSKMYDTGMPYKDICGKCGAVRIDNQIGLEPDYNDYIKKLCDIFSEVKRTLKKEGSLYVNIGDSYAGSGKAGNDPKYKENCTSFNKMSVFHKERFGMPTNNMDIPDKSLVMIPFRFAIEMVNRGWRLRNTIIWHKPNSMPASVKDRYTVDFEYMFFFTKSKRYYFEQQFEPINIESIKRNRRAKKSNKYTQTDFKYNASNLDKERPYLGYEGIEEEMENSDGRNKRTVWHISTKPFTGAHFAVYPPELIETPIKASCPKGGIVLDPFLGSGTSALVALQQNKNYIGIELNTEYVKLATERIEDFKPQLKFDNMIK